MKSDRGFKYILKPNESQKRVLKHYMFVDNQVRNICISLYQKRYEENQAKPKDQRTYYKTMDLYYIAKKILSERQIFFKTELVLNAVRNFEKDFKLTFKVNGRGLPKYHSSEKHKHFVKSNQNLKVVDINSKWSYIQFWGEKIKFRRHRPIKGKNLYASFKENSVGDFFVSFCQEFDSPEAPQKSNAVGIDLNIHNVTTSDGIVYLNGFQTKHSKKFKRLQRKVSKKPKGTKNRKKLQLKLNKLHLKSANKIKDFNHKLSKTLTEGYGTIICENLRSMQNSTKVQRGIKRSLSQVNFSQLLSFLEYKAKHNGTKVKRVDPSYTSKACSHCGAINNALSLRDRTYNCGVCGLSLDRDYNAAINILNRGLGTSPSAYRAPVDLQYVTYGEICKSKIRLGKKPGVL